MNEYLWVSNVARVPVQLNLELNWEGVKLQFDSSIKNGKHTLSIEPHAVLGQMNSTLNWEGVELQFDQSYQFELTTNPLGKHYIIS
jgi:hypothetical protein